MRMLWLCLALSGCCCDVPGLGGSTQTWAFDVKRAKENPQTVALEPGTANVFQFEVQQPVGLTQAQQDARFDHLQRLEAAKLELKLAEVLHETDRFAELRAAIAAVEAEPQPTFSAWETITRYRFVMVHPYSMLFDNGFVTEGGAACLREADRSSIYMYSPGSMDVPLGTVTREMLLAGVEVHERFSFGTVSEADSRSLWIPPPSRGVLKLVESCPAEVAYVTKSVKVGAISGIMELPKYDDRSWFELRGAPCARSVGTVEAQVTKSTLTPPQLTDVATRIMVLKVQIERGYR